MLVEVEMRSIDGRDGERQDVRHQLRLPIEGSIGNRAIMRDLSRTGLMLETSDALAVGETLEIDFHGTSAYAHVVWREGTMVGCQFRQPISRSAISAALLQSPMVSQESPTWEEGIVGALARNGADNFDRSRPVPGVRLVVLVTLAIAAWIIVALTVL